MRMLKLSLLFAVLLASPAAAQLVNENLLVPLPEGYKVGFQTRKNNMDMQEMVPANETVDNWTEMVTVQIFHGIKALPGEFRRGLELRWRSNCPNTDAAQIASDADNGYPALVWLLSCPNNPATGKPEITWFKAVAGNDSFYLVQKAFKFEPSKEQAAQSVHFLEAVKACDSRLPDRACPMAKP
jgi:hypothetical protein